MNIWTDCKRVPLPSLLSFIVDNRGKTVPTAENGHILIATNCIKNDHLYPVYEKVRFLSQETYDTFFRAHPKPGDIIFVNKGTPGRCALVPDPVDFCIAQDMMAFRVDSSKVNNLYLLSVLRSYEIQRMIYSISVGDVIPHFKKQMLDKILVPLPPLDIQNIIADVFSDLNIKIENNRRICENLEAQAQALFKHWFVDFAPFKDGKFVESELGLIPEGWRVGKAEDFYTINIGKTPPRAERQWFSESKGNNNIWISISDMGSCGTFISDSKEYLTPEAQSKFNIVMVPVGTILLSFKLTIGRVAIADNELTTNEAIARFILPNSDYREFTYLYLKQYKYGSLGSTSSIATAVNSKIIKSMPFLMPSTEVMAEFSTVVSKLFDEIRILSIESLRLASLRDTLLPKLMSGQIKL